jgi:hypothetical protein
MYTTESTSGSSYVFLGKWCHLLALHAWLTSLNSEAKEHLLPLLCRSLGQMRAIFRKKEK